MYDYTFLNLQITRSDIRPYIKSAVSLVITYYYGHFNLPQGFVWVCMDSHTRFITHDGMSMAEELCTQCNQDRWTG